MLAPAAALGLCVFLLGSLFVFGRMIGPGLSLLLAFPGLVSLAAALFLTILKLPDERPLVRRAAGVMLAVGGIAILMMTPFGAMALVALACR
jgi:hypothetical protein